MGCYTAFLSVVEESRVFFLRGEVGGLEIFAEDDKSSGYFILRFSIASEDTHFF